MPMPFEKIMKRPGLRRILVPFTIGLVLVGIIAFALTST